MGPSKAARDLMARHGVKVDPRQADVLAQHKASQPAAIKARLEEIRAQENARLEALRTDITRKLRQQYPQMNRTGLRHLVEAELKQTVYFDSLADFFPNACRGYYGFPFLFKKDSAFMSRLRMSIAIRIPAFLWRGFRAKGN